MKTLKVNLPGFTAENAIAKVRKGYGLTTAFDSNDAVATVQPAMARVCHVLAELVWGAYNEGAYNRAEFWEGVMDRAGCFR